MPVRTFPPPAAAGQVANAWGALTRWARPPSAPAPCSTDGRVIYAIGDIHGCADLLVDLLARIADDAAATGGDPRLVLLGDYVDRGPHSRRVLDKLVALRGERPGLVHLLGNHDDLMLRFLTQPALGPAWCERGGGETLTSYDVKVPPLDAPEEAWSCASAALGVILPPQHLHFLAEAHLSWSSGDYFFSHAGARPGVPLHLQARRDLLGIRGEFLQGAQRFSKVVVHGHTPSSQVHIDHRRIGVDTGAYATGVLAAVRISNGQIRVIQAHRRRSSSPGPVARAPALHSGQGHVGGTRWTEHDAARCWPAG